MFTATLIRDTLSCHRQNSSRNLLVRSYEPRTFPFSITPIYLLLPRWPRIDLELTSGLPAARGEDHSGARRRGRTHRQQLPLGRHSERCRRPKGQIILKREIVLKRQVSLPNYSNSSWHRWRVNRIILLVPTSRGRILNHWTDCRYNLMVYYSGLLWSVFKMKDSISIFWSKLNACCIQY